MSSDNRDAAALACAAALVYLAGHSYLYNFDGVACAIAVELGDLRLLVHGNHLGYGVLGWAFHRLWVALGYGGPAILPLQAINSLLGAAAVGVFYTSLRRTGARRLVCAGAACGMALSHGFWLWSLEAQVYPLGLLFMALSLREALAARPRPGVLGVFQGLAVLGHVGHAAFAPAALFALRRRHGPRWTSAAARWAAAAAATVALAYVWAAVFCVRPGSLEQLRVWLLGSAALNLDKSFQWHGTYSLPGLVEWLRMAPRLFADFRPFAGTARAAAVVLGLTCLAAAAAGARLSWGRERAFIPKLCALWLAPYAALYLSWEPFTMMYRLSDLLPLWLLIAVGAETLRPAWTTAALAAVLGAFNATRGVGRHFSPESNPYYLEALWLEQAAPPDAWVVASGLGQVYYPYFARRRPLNMRYWTFRLPELAARLDGLRAAGERVFVTEVTLVDGGWKDWFARYGLRARASRGTNVLYEVTGKGSPAAARKRG